MSNRVFYIVLICFSLITLFFAKSATENIALTDFDTEQIVHEYKNYKLKQRENQVINYYENKISVIVKQNNKPNNSYKYNANIISKGASPNKTYYVSYGDTLSKISFDTSISVDKLANYNQIRDVNLIYAGSVLQIP